MGCAGSKDVAVADVVYCPPATSVSLFDVSAVEEPWLIAKQNAANGDAEVEEEDDDEEDDDDDDEEEEEEEDEDDGAAKKPTTGVAIPLLDKLDGYELAPASWSEVSKALEDIKPTLNSKPAASPTLPPKKKKKKKKTKRETAQAPAPAQAPEPEKQQPSSQTPSSVAGADEAGKKASPSQYVRGAEGVDTKPRRRRKRTCSCCGTARATTQKASGGGGTRSRGTPSGARLARAAAGWCCTRRRSAACDARSRTASTRAAVETCAEGRESRT